MEEVSPWVVAIAAVNFDLELGQSIEHLEPPDYPLTQQEKLNICYLSFPDSNSGCSGDTTYHFRIRKEYSVTCQRDDIPRDNTTPHTRDNQYYYGYVFFRQRRGDEYKRGYFQKSLVLLTKKPYVNLYLNILRIVAPQFFESGQVAVEVAMHNLASWGPPQPGKSFQVPLLGQVLAFHFPSLEKSSAATKHFPTHIMAPKPVMLRSIVECSLYESLYPILPHLSVLWELVLIGEPIVVFGSSPTVTSALVQSLVSAIRPLRYANDYRPYFTIHDSEFKELSSKTHPPRRVILGVTNPFFNKALQHWPHVIVVGEPNKTLKILNPKEHGNSSLRGKPGFYTRYKSLLNKDKQLRRLHRGEHQRPSEVEDIMARRYLTELTHTFMIPLEQYVSSLMPLQRSIAPFRHPPLLQPFHTDTFLVTVEDGGPKVNSDLKGNWRELYRRFLRSPTFELWFTSKRHEANQRLELLHVQCLCEADIYGWMSGKHEVEVVDMLLWIRDRYEALDRLSTSSELKGHLKNHIDTLLGVVPPDLQITLKPAFT